MKKIEVQEDHFNPELPKGNRWLLDFLIMRNQGTLKEQSEAFIDSLDAVLNEARRIIKVGDAKTVSIWRFAKKPAGGIQSHCVSMMQATN